MSQSKVYSLEAIQRISVHSALPPIPDVVVKRLNLLHEQLRVPNLKYNPERRMVALATPQKIASIDGQKIAPPASSWAGMLQSSNSLATVNNVNDPAAEIRSLINKISKQNYKDLIGKIKNAILERREQHPTMETDVKKMVFQVASLNRFNSALYAKLYRELCSTFDGIHRAFDPEQEVATWFSDITYVDPEKDYSLFCEFTKQNERRRSIMEFYLHLSEEGVISSEVIGKFSKTVVSLLYKWISESNRVHETDELVELVAVLYNPAIFKDDCHAVDNHNMDEIVHTLSVSKSKDFASLSQKSVFKCKDIIENRIRR